MKHAILIARILFGLVFFVFGLNGFFNFIPAPEPSGPAGDFFLALVATGYMIPLIKATEVVAGALLLAGRFVPLALVLLAPVVVNIVLLHSFLEITGLPVALLVLALEIFLAWAYRGSFAGVLAATAKPTL